jgi:putative endonuclease
MSGNYYVYILSNWTGDVLYIGMTNNMERRLYEHKQKLVPGFTKKYSVTKLVYLELAASPDEAIAREKQLKNWRREKKDALINAQNPDWKDLSEDWHTRSLDFARDDKNE